MKNVERLHEIYSEAFPNESKAYIANFIDKTSENNIFTYEQSDEIVSVVYVVDKIAKLDKTTAVLPYLVAIATKYEYRGKNLVNYPIRMALNYLQSRGDMFVVLYPFNHNYYTKFDFSNVSYGTTAVVSGGRDFSVRVATVQDIDSMVDIAKKAGRNKYFCQEFDSHMIENMLNDYNIDNSNIYIVSDGGCGYRGCDDFAFFGENASAIDLVVTYDYVKFSSLNSRKGHEYTKFCDEGQPQIQARVVDARAVLTQFGHLLQPNIVYRLTDNMIVHNNFCFAIVEGKTKFYESHHMLEDGEPNHMNMSISTLCQIVWQSENGTARNVFYDKY